MEYRRMGRTGLRVSTISLGSWLTYGKSVEDTSADQIIKRAYELGVNFFDSANVYERGEGERVMASCLRPYPRESYVITTKAFWPMGDGVNDRGLSRKHVYEQLHNSLRRMKLEYVDIFYCHRFDKDTPLEETLRVIDDLVRQGKVLYVGVSQWSAHHVEEAMRIADQYLLDRIVVNQPGYSMLDRTVEEEVFPVCEKYGIGQVAFSPLAQGVLTGKYQRGVPEDSRASKEGINHWVKQILEKESLPGKIIKLQALAEEAGLTLVQLALAWVLRKPIVCSALVGASSVTQIEANVLASGVSLSKTLQESIEEVLQS